MFRRVPVRRGRAARCARSGRGRLRAPPAAPRRSPTPPATDRDDSLQTLFFMIFHYTQPRKDSEPTLVYNYPIYEINNIENHSSTRRGSNSGSVDYKSSTQTTEPLTLFKKKSRVLANFINLCLIRTNTDPLKVPGIASYNTGLIPQKSSKNCEILRNNRAFFIFILTNIFNAKV